jgi:hypothetical protein
LEALDRTEQARLALLEHGLVYTEGKGLVRSRPEFAIERDSRFAYLRAMRELPSIYQSDSHALRMRCWASWALRASGAIAWMNSVAW